MRAGLGGKNGLEWGHLAQVGPSTRLLFMTQLHLRLVYLKLEKKRVKNCHRMNYAALSVLIIPLSGVVAVPLALVDPQEPISFSPLRHPFCQVCRRR